MMRSCSHAHTHTNRHIECSWICRRQAKTLRLTYQTWRRFVLVARFTRKTTMYHTVSFCWYFWINLIAFPSFSKFWNWYDLMILMQPFWIRKAWWKTAYRWGRSSAFSSLAASVGLCPTLSNRPGLRRVCRVPSSPELTGAGALLGLLGDASIFSGLKFENGKGCFIIWSPISSHFCH